MQGFWLGDRKVRPHVVRKDQCQLPGKRTAGEVRREGG